MTSARKKERGGRGKKEGRRKKTPSGENMYIIKLTISRKCNFRYQHIVEIQWEGSWEVKEKCTKAFCAVQDSFNLLWSWGWSWTPNLSASTSQVLREQDILLILVYGVLGLNPGLCACWISIPPTELHSLALFKLSHRNEESK